MGIYEGILTDIYYKPLKEDDYWKGYSEMDAAFLVGSEINVFVLRKNIQLRLNLNCFTVLLVYHLFIEKRWETDIIRMIK